MSFAVHTEVFDGPLDLLLYLVKKDGVDLRLVSVARVADAYLEYLDRMRELNLGVAGEYLVMAATLVHLKSLDLLPRPPTSTVAEETSTVDPREVLVRRLLDHQRFREAALQLDDRPQVGRDVFTREPADVSDEPRPLVAGVDAFGLLDLYHAILVRRSTPEPTYDVSTSGLDLETCCTRLLARLTAAGGRGELGELLRAVVVRLERVLTFLSVLEMARLRWVTLEQAEHLGPVWVERVVGDVDLKDVVGRFSSVAT